MLVLKRREGQWIEITHRSGDILRIRVYKIEPGQPGHLNLAFDDDAHHFEIERPERAARLAARGNRTPVGAATSAGDQP